MKNIDYYASSILEHLGEILPDVDDDGELGELALEKALDMYRETLLVILKTDS